MGNWDNSTYKQVEQPFILTEGEKIEIEAKLDLDRPIDIFSLPWPNTFEVKKLEDRRVTEHVFYYDEHNRYLFSITENTAIKIKTEPQLAVFEDVPILVRSEAIHKKTPGEIPFRYEVSRRLRRKRSSLWLVDLFESDRFFVMFDICTDQTGRKLYQLEIEFSSGTTDPAHMENTLVKLAKLVKHVELWLPSEVKVSLNGLTKYDWLKTMKEVMGWRRFFNLG